MEGMVEMATPSPYGIQMVTPPIVLGDEAQVDTGQGKLNNGNSDETSIRDGTPLWLDMDVVPEYLRPQRDEANPVRKRMMKKNLTLSALDAMYRQD
jgi:hypothetical protein